MTTARWWHGATAAVVIAALALQTVLVVSGAAVLVDQQPPALPVRLGRLVSYFTVQSNAVVAVSVVALTLDPARDGRWWRVLRTAGVVGITVTGVVHWFALRPLLDLEGADLVADRLLHLVVPVLTVVGWLVWGPRPRSGARTALLALCWPVAWLVWTLLVGALTGWYPYPFLDAGARGGGAVAVACVGVTALFTAVSAVVVLLDRVLSPAPRADGRPPYDGREPPARRPEPTS